MTARPRRWAAVVEAFVALQALLGGVALARDAWHLDRTDLHRLPLVETWRLPGLALVLGVGVPMAVAARLEWRRSSLAAAATTTVGTLLVLWIGLQLVVLPSLHLWLQPACALVGAVLALDGGRRLRRRPPSRRPRRSRAVSGTFGPGRDARPGPSSEHDLDRHDLDDERRPPAGWPGR